MVSVSSSAPRVIGALGSAAGKAAAYGKIVSLDELRPICEALRTQNKRIVLCHGVFDLFHIGHLRHFEAAKKQGAVLVVSITADEYVNKGPNRPVFPAELRAELLASLDIVDWVTIVHHQSAEPAIEAIKPDVYAKGSDYADPAQDITGKIRRETKLVEQHGGRVEFTHDLMFSSSNLLNNHFNLLDKPVRAYLAQLREAGGMELIAGFLDRIARMRILLVGETIIDHYNYVTAMGKAAKENIIATLHQGEELFPGGVIAAANHLASICPNVEVVTILGHPDFGENYEALVRDKLLPNIRPTIIYRPNGPTIRKTRFVEPTYVRKLFEVYRMDDTPLPEDVRSSIHTALRRRIEDVDAVLVCDFGHGLIASDTVRLFDEARFLAVTAQTNSGNVGYNTITKYASADLVCLDAMEARLAAQDKHTNLPDMMTDILMKLVDCRNLIVTHGKAGCFTASAGDDQVNHIPALTNSVLDTVGAGDAFFMMAGSFAAAGAPCSLAGFVGNVAGAIKVGIVGHRRYISRLELQRYIETLLK